MRMIRCPRCKQMYEHDGPLAEACPRCRRERDAQYYAVRELVKAFPGITAMEVHEQMDIPLPTILRYIDEGRLEVMPDVSPDQLEQMRSLIKKTAQKKNITIAEVTGKPAPPPTEKLTEKPIKTTPEVEKPAEEKPRKQGIHWIIDEEAK